jgi:M6 family metalloprotease-like protein
VCGDFLPVGDETNFITVAHEFAHLLGALDLYGDRSNSYRYTLMSSTWEAGEFLVNLDPWHKMRMGLVAPRIIPIPASRSARQEVRLTHPGNYHDYQPVLFYAPGRANEYFLLEFRRQGASTFDSEPVW